MSVSADKYVHTCFKFGKIVIFDSLDKFDFDTCLSHFMRVFTDSCHFYIDKECPKFQLRDVIFLPYPSRSADGAQHRLRLPPPEQTGAPPPGRPREAAQGDRAEARRRPRRGALRHAQEQPAGRPHHHLRGTAPASPAEQVHAVNSS